MNIVKEIDIENRTYYFFHDPNQLKTDENP